MVQRILATRHGRLSAGCVPRTPVRDVLRRVPVVDAASRAARAPGNAHRLHRARRCDHHVRGGAVRRPFAGRSHRRPSAPPAGRNAASVSFTPARTSWPWLGSKAGSTSRTRNPARAGCGTVGGAFARGAGCTSRQANPAGREGVALGGWAVGPLAELPSGEGGAGWSGSDANRYWWRVVGCWAVPLAYLSLRCSSSAQSGRNRGEHSDPRRRVGAWERSGAEGVRGVLGAQGRFPSIRRRRQMTPNDLAAMARMREARKPNIHRIAERSACISKPGAPRSALVARAARPMQYRSILP